MKKLIFALSLFVAISVFLCSCTATREIDEQSIVSAIGFDWSDRLTVTVEVLTVDIDRKYVSTRTFTASGTDIESAFNSLNKKLPKRLFYDHCAAIIISADTDEKHLKKLLYTCIDEPTINLSTPVVFTDDIALLLSCSHESAAVGYDIMEVLRHNKKEEQSRLYKAARQTKNILTFKNRNDKAALK